MTLTASLSEGPPERIAELDGEELAVVVEETEAPEGELFAEGAPWRFAAFSDGRVLAGDVRRARGGRRRLRRAARGRPTTPRRCAWSPRRSRTTRCSGAYLLDPARRGYPLAELLEERGLASDLEDPVAAQATMLAALADWQREQIDERGLRAVMDEIELPLVRVLRELELLGVRLNLERLAEITTRVSEEIGGLEREIFALAARSSRSAPRSSSARSSSSASGCRASAAARPATRPTPACCRRSAPSTRSCPRSSAGASSRH